MPASEQDCRFHNNRSAGGGKSQADIYPAVQVRFNVLRVLPRTGKAVKKFSKF